MKLKICILSLFLLTGCAKDTNIVDKFSGLEAKTTFEQYKIYDLVEQKNLACAEMIEFIGNDTEYQYYFNCLKSDQIYFVSQDEIIKVKHFYNAGLISLEKLYELKIIDRMEKQQ